jgi:hypothetical protein
MDRIAETFGQLPERFLTDGGNTSGLVQQAILDSDARARLIELRQPAFTQLRAWLQDVEAFWGDQLKAFKAHAERGRKRERR